MSLTTRCPSCGTMFKVVPDQLRISDGWVRCGHCTDVFDASAHLLSPDALVAEVRAVAPEVVPAGDMPGNMPGDGGEPPVPAPSAPAVWQRRSVAARTVLHAEPPEEDTAEDGDGEEDEEGDAAPSRAPADTADPSPADSRGHADSFFPHGADDDLPPLPILTEDVPSALLLQTADSDESQDLLYQTAFAVPTAPPAGSAEARIAAQEDRDAAEAAAALPAFGFVRAAERRAFWRRPLVAAASLAVCLLLGTALLLQVLVFERDRIAASLPGLRPVLEALCAPVACQVAPLKRIDALVIDGSGFNKARGELYQLSLDLRSTAGVPLAMPSLELTLTDSDDRTLLRRVLTPTELHAPQVLPVRGAWSGTLPVRLKEAADAARVAGYRVLVFYP
ncbi:MAG: zinc-ribbon and DUF3426 domain-containing protein [Pseudomonadota bacterium]